MTKKEPPRNQKIYERSTQERPGKPRPPFARPEDIWERIEDLLGDEPAKSQAPPEPDKRPRRSDRRRKRRLRRRMRLLDIAGYLAWTLVITKLFIGDVDRVLLGAVAPNLVWVLDTRFLLVLFLFALLLILFKARTLGIALAYVAGFPLVVLFWKLPRLLIKSRSPLLALGLAALAVSVVGRYRLFVIAHAAATLSGLLIVFSDTGWLIGFGMAALFATLVWWLAVTAIDLIRTPRFVRVQEKAIKKLLGWKVIENLVTPISPDQVSLKTWTTEDAKKYRDSAGNALLARQLLNFWAYSLDEYRKGPSLLLLNAAAGVGILLQVIIVFTFLNYGAFLIDPIGFNYTLAPNGWTFAYYSTTAAYFGEISALTPTGPVPILVKLLNGAVGVIGVGTIITTVILNFRSIRADRASVSVVQLLRDRASTLESQSAEQFQMSMAELEKRLITASWGMLSVLGWLTNKTPEDWEQDSSDELEQTP